MPIRLTHKTHDHVASPVVGAGFIPARQVTATSKALLLTMVTSRGVRPNRYAKELVAGELTLEDLFRS